MEYFLFQFLHWKIDKCWLFSRNRKQPLVKFARYFVQSTIVEFLIAHFFVVQFLKLNKHGFLTSDRNNKKQF